MWDYLLQINLVFNNNSIRMLTWHTGSPTWSEFFSSTTKHLEPTASLVKSTVLGSKADGTVRTYLGGLRRWKLWASSNHVCCFPANPFQVAIYLQCLLQDANSVLLQFLTPFIALTGRSRWHCCLKSPLILWFPLWSVSLRGFWEGPRLKKILWLRRC